MEKDSKILYQVDYLQDSMRVINMFLRLPALEQVRPFTSFSSGTEVKVMPLEAAVHAFITLSKGYQQNPRLNILDISSKDGEESILEGLLFKKTKNMINIPKLPLQKLSKITDRWKSVGQAGSTFPVCFLWQRGCPPSRPKEAGQKFHEKSSQENKFWL